MIAILTSFRCLVRAAMRSVVSCRSNSVRPHDGQETNSVFVTRTPAACRMPNSSRSRSAASSGAVSATASPMPSAQQRAEHASRVRSRTSSSSLVSERAASRSTGRRSPSRSSWATSAAVGAHRVVPGHRLVERAMPLRSGVRPVEGRLGRVEHGHRARRRRPASRRRPTPSDGGRRRRGRSAPARARRRRARGQPSVVGRDQPLGDRHLGFRLLGERDAHGVAQAVVEQGADADGRLDAPILAQAGLGHAQVERVVEAFLVHARHQQPVGLDHDLRIRGLHRQHDVVVVVARGDAQELQRRLDHARGVSP